MVGKLGRNALTGLRSQRTGSGDGMRTGSGEGENWYLLSSQRMDGRFPCSSSRANGKGSSSKHGVAIAYICTADVRAGKRLGDHCGRVA